jgi:flagellar hook-length control protein FliK
MVAATAAVDIVNAAEKGTAPVAGPAMVAVSAVPAPADAPPDPDKGEASSAGTMAPQYIGAGHAFADLAGAREIRPNASAPHEIASRFGTPAFADEFGNRVVWMAGHNQQAAEFHIDPPQLGPVEVRLSLASDQASLVLLSPHASVRDALQATLPRLQDMLAAAGINLGSVHVGSHSRSGGQAADDRAATSGRPSSHAVQQPGDPAVWTRTSIGLVDLYA